MARKITKQGQAVKGALAAYVAPRLATDQAIKPGEIDKLILSQNPADNFTTQIPKIVSAAKETFKGRLAADTDLDDLPEILEALREAEEEDGYGEEELEDGKPKSVTGDEEEDLSMDENPGVKLMEMLGKCNIPPDQLEQMNALITALGKGKEEGMKDEALPGKPGVEVGAEVGAKPKDKEKTNFVSKPAMDAALAAQDQKTRSNLAELFAAAEDVKPVLGRIDALAFDAAPSVYKLALDQHFKDVKLEGVHPSAYKALFQLAQSKAAVSDQPAPLALDQKEVESFEKRYTTIPAQA